MRLPLALLLLVLVVAGVSATPTPLAREPVAAELGVVNFLLFYFSLLLTFKWFVDEATYD